MQRTSLVATVLLSAVLGAVLAVLAPSAAAASPLSGTEGSPGNRGWVFDPRAPVGDD